MCGDTAERSIDANRVEGYCENMRNITVSVDDDTYRMARTRAASQDTSLSAVVRMFLADYATAADSERERLKRLELAARAQITAFRAADRLDRDAVHCRNDEP
ncbi:hypothetical protein BVIR_407 [Blastochloris viridis]|nr:hypothetical protein BVIR_407 [Blastochloris viridis]